MSFWLVAVHNYWRRITELKDEYCDNPLHARQYAKLNPNRCVSCAHPVTFQLSNKSIGTVHLQVVAYTVAYTDSRLVATICVARLVSHLLVKELHLPDHEEFRSAPSEFGRVRRSPAFSASVESRRAFV
jgi:hypothetical protein